MIDFFLPSEVRQRCRSGQLTTPTPGLAPGYVQSNLVVLPADLAFEFLLFCQRNPKPCPILEVTAVGDPEPKQLAPGADIRTDLPCYEVFRRGELVEETTDITPFWQDDLVAFLVGCSFSFENAMLNADWGMATILEKCYHLDLKGLYRSTFGVLNFVLISFLLTVEIFLLG